jgi:ABC-type multidrug transport system ATPase subunit
LSGGEQKRLSIAIEIIHDPKILFVDEPTTGLDSFASTNCVRHLKKLASEGKTVIITIHQPSALILSLFDHVYALAEGRCIYQGTSEKIVPFLSDIDLVCPETYNPADFLLEIANNDYGEYNQVLSEKIVNGLNDEYRKSPCEKLIRKNGAKIPSDNEEIYEEKYSTKFTCQVYNLMLRTFLITSRDRTLFYMRLLIHLFIGLGFGFIYKDVGNNGGAMFDNYRFLVVSVVFLLYTSYHSHLVTCK